MAIEFENKINFTEKQQIVITYHGKKAGVYTPDFIVDEKILIEVKAVDFMPKIYEEQLYAYPKGTKYKLGYLLNFSCSKIDIRRRIHETAKKN